MNPILRNILAVIVGLIVGSCANMAIIVAGPSIVPLPPGIDPMDVESLKENMHLFEAKHYIMPFLAHALGTLVGAVVAFKIAATKKAVFAYVIGGLFLIGGIMNVMQLPAPMWFNVLDLAVAYIPMAFLATRIGKG